LAGQSNAVGRGPYYAITQALLDFDFQNVYIYAGGDIEKAASMRNLEIMDYGYGKYTSESGPEAGMAHEYIRQKGSKRAIIIKYAWGATTLSLHWRPSSLWVTPPAAGSQPGYFYKTFLETWEAALAKIRTKDWTPVYRGFLWVQGESDSQAQAEADAYEGRLRTFVRDIKADLNKIYPKAEDMPFIISECAPITAAPYYEITREAQRKVAAEISQPTVNTDGLRLISDNTHFDFYSLKRIGEDFMKIVLDEE